MKALTFLLLGYVLHSFAEVLQTFNRCNKFFFDRKVPSGFPSTFHKICQKYGNKYHFATLYDTGNRIPVYSAYIYKKRAAGGRHADWKIEPQLSKQNWPPNMMTMKDLIKNVKTYPPKQIRTNIKLTQAVNNDYRGNYDKGHLNPVCHQCSQAAKNATFTFTNAAPMRCTLNRGEWKSMEFKWKNLKDCNGTKTYIITGTSSTLHTGKLNNRVAVPQYVWSAMCCRARNRNVISHAAIGDNTNCTVTYLTVADCEVQLSHWFNSNISLFQGKC
ncbi:endonuclease domain-containing 1 protein-like [Protopterus annectens]|uniref:endonuclease domain-containing 1 protein-like n=1 Tax=Protopterus annectens TaxID=7888 RepID=UPI001CF9F3F0|nr:endonuclease domain-containing 1 protein-like [Protopterus annectens]